MEKKWNNEEQLVIDRIHEISALFSKSELLFYGDTLRLEQLCNQLDISQLTKMARKFRRPLESELLDPKPFLSILGEYKVGKLITSSNAWIFKLDHKTDKRILRANWFTSQEETSKNKTTVDHSLIASQLGIGPTIYGHTICQTKRNKFVSFIVMQKLQKTLDSTLFNFSTTRQALALFYDLMIKGKLVHTDLHEKNIMFDENSKMHLIDFENCYEIRKEDETDEFFYQKMIIAAAYLLHYHFHTMAIIDIKIVTNNFVKLHACVEDWIHALFPKQTKRMIVHDMNVEFFRRLNLDADENVLKRVNIIGSL